MVRGNREICSRAGEGWFRFLDHARPADECTLMNGSFVVALGDLGLVVINSGQIAKEKLAIAMLMTRMKMMSRIPVIQAASSPRSATIIPKYLVVFCRRVGC